MNAVPLALDGYLDTVPEPDDGGTTARFRLVTSPTDDREDEAIVPCTAKDPHIAHALLNKIRPGDLVRVPGLLTLPGSADGGLQLKVDALEWLSTVPTAEGTVIERMGPYLIVFDPDTDKVPVFTEAGTWVGEADDADDISDVIDRFEHEQEAS
ncbi:hypothetical protein [Streptomyces mirabilis]|uniref:hypothetical protein n=1 Tax=Streptomyces mirabilis TaxID=68239 RepID=UPI0034379712